MNPDAIELLQSMAARFGVAVDYLWPLLVLYTRWLNIGRLVLDTIFFVVGLVVIAKSLTVLTRQMYLYNHRDDEDYVDYTMHALLSVFAVIAMVASMVIGLIIVVNVPWHLAGAAVPETQAIFDLLGQIKSK